MKLKTVVILLAIGTLLTACSLKTPKGGVPSDAINPNGNGSDESPNPTDVQTITEAVIKVTNDGFAPQSVVIKKGGEVTWINESDGSAWVASAFHPTHLEYPGLDELAGMAKGKSWSFTFDKVGIWRYHDHLNPSRFGTVTVEE